MTRPAEPSLERGSATTRLKAEFIPAIFTLDAEGRFERVGLRLARLLGVRWSELVGASLSDFLDSYDDDTFADRWFDLRAGGQGLEMDTTLVLRDGERRRVRLDLLPQDPTGDPSRGYAGVLTPETGHRGKPAAEFDVAKTLMDTIGTMLLVADPNGTPLFSNAAIRARFGRPLDRKCVFTLIHPEDRAATVDAWNDAVAAGQPFTLEMRMSDTPETSVEADYRWIRFRARPHHDDTGRVRFWAATLEDLGEEMAIRTELRESRRFVSQLGEASPDVLYLYDLERGRNVYCSESSTRVFGYTPEEIGAMGAEVLERLVHPEDQPWLFEEMARNAADSEAPDHAHPLEYRILRRDGEMIWIATRTIVFERHPDGRPKINLGIAQEITERKRTEIEREDHARILEHALSGVAVVDREGRYVYANAGYAAIVGNSTAELVGRHWCEDVHPDDAEEMRDEYERMLWSGRIETECRGLRPDGTITHQQAVMIPKYEGERFAGHYRFLHDTTERVRFQHQLESQLAHISSMTAELEQRSHDLERANAILAKQASSDGLTGLANHRAFQETLQALNESGTPHALLLLDVDHFKAYNDAFGHPAGDEVLIRFARVLDELTIEGELPARYGGEEFALVLPGIDLEGAEMRAELLLRRLAEIEWPHRAITASIGAVAWTPGRARAELIEAADRALYVSKRNGRNQVSMAA